MTIYPRGTLGVSLFHLASSRRPFSVYGCFKKLLDRWSNDDDEEIIALKNFLLFSEEPCANGATLQAMIRYSTWALCAQQWRLNIHYFRRQFGFRRFCALARPGMNTYLPMIRLRRLIVGMRDQFPDARADSVQLERYFEKSIRAVYPSLLPPTLGQTLTEVFGDLNKLDKELNDEIHLIIGAVTVQDSDANKVQTERATLLTLLAAVYLPLTLVTGIFGMNIKDINDGNPSWRACGEVLAVVAVCTIVFVVAYRGWRGWRKGRRNKERTELGFRKDV